MKKSIMLLISVLFILSGCMSAPATVGNIQTVTHQNSEQPVTQTEAPPVLPNITETPALTESLLTTGSDSIGDTYYPSLGNGGYDVQKYTLILDVDMKTGLIKALTRIEAKTTQELSIFTLDFTGMEWDAVRVNEASAEFTRKIRKIEIKPQETLASDTPFTVEIEYHGLPWTIDSFSGGTVGWFRAPDGTINVFTEPDGAYAWFPCNNHPRDKALYRFEVTVDDPWVAAANGFLVETIPLDGRTTHIFEQNDPMATYLATVNIDHYDLVTAQGPDGILIRNYFPTDLPESQRENYEILPEVIEYFSSLFGPFPAKVYGVLIMDENAAHCLISPFGDETQSLTIVCPSPRTTGEYTIVHEFTHEWFGDSVSLENWQDLWLKEGMATYARCLWDMREDGANVDLDTCMKEQAGDYDGTYPVNEPPRNDIFCTEAYTGGSLVYYSLHQKVGDEMFFKIIRTYLERFRGSYAGTDDFIALVNEVTGEDLEDDIREWLKNPVVPK